MSARAARPARPTRAFFILTYLFDVSFETTRRNDPANFLWMTRSKIYHFFYPFMPVECLALISYSERLNDLKHFSYATHNIYWGLSWLPRCPLPSSLGRSLLKIKKISSKNLILFTSVTMLSPIRNHTTHTRAVNISLRYPRLRYCGNRSTIAVTTPSIPTNLKARLRKLSCCCQNPNKSVQGTHKFPVWVEITLNTGVTELEFKIRTWSFSWSTSFSGVSPVSPPAGKPWERRRLPIHWECTC